jgi:hypothetical protein
MDFEKLNEIAARVTAGEFHMFLSMWRGASGIEVVRCTLEKGSTYSKFHMKVEASGATPSEAFENALRQFPPQPLEGQWDSVRLTGPTGPVEDGEFTETTK